MFNLQYQQTRIQQLQQKAQANLQEGIQAQFKMVAQAKEIDDEIKERQQIIVENTPKETEQKPKVEAPKTEAVKNKK